MSARSRTRTHPPTVVEEQWVDGAEVHVDHFFARRTSIGRKGPVGLGAALVAEEHLRALVAHEDGSRSPDLGRQ